ncbi:MAG TPA: diguanylate cyclase, partial [Fimbriimonadaceae bacterium]|nr:diguanylate cyclase [Fimbriimonadaceae bacterium]
DLVCRHGETGFGIILPGTGQNVALVRSRLVERVTEWMSARYAQGSPVRVEIGHAAYPDAGRFSADLLAAAAPAALEPARAA